MKTVRYPTFDGTRNQAKVNKFLNVFFLLKTLNGLDDADLVRLVVQHLRSPALLWWLEAADSIKSQQLFAVGKVSRALSDNDLSNGTRQ